MYANNVTRYNQPTLDLLEDLQLIDEVRRFHRIGASKRAISRKLGLSWRQINAIVHHIERKGVMKEA